MPFRVGFFFNISSYVFLFISFCQDDLFKTFQPIFYGLRKGGGMFPFTDDINDL